MKYDVIVIGGGLGGLECGYILSRQGLRVLVLEQGHHPGGCIQSYRRNGISYDTGFHYVGGLDEGQSLYAAFRYLGLLDLPWKRLDAEGFDRVTIGERTFAFAQGYDEFAKTLAVEFPAEREALSRYADLLQKSSDYQAISLSPSSQENELNKVWSWAEQGAYPYLTEQFHSPLLINVLSGTSLKMELCKDTLPLFTFIHGNSSFIESSWRLKGDGSLLVNALVEGIKAQGGEIRCRAQVCELIEQDGRLTKAVCKNGETYEGTAFISDIHPASTCGLVAHSRLLKPVYRNRMVGLQNTFGMFTVSLRLKPKALRYFNWNHYLYRKPDVWDFYERSHSVDGVLFSCRVPEGDETYAEVLDLLTPMPWQQCAVWQDSAVGRRGEEYEAYKNKKADQCIELAEQAIPGLHGMVEERYISTPLTYRDYTLAPQGTAYGVRKDYHRPLQTLFSPRTPIPNLYLTGQNLMLHGLHGVTMTAFHTCAAVIGRDTIWNILKNK